MVSIFDNLQAVKGRIQAACLAYGRDANIVTSCAQPSDACPPHTLCLLAVSKTFSADAVRQAHAAGQRAFGENHVQEALAKMAELADVQRTDGSGVQWHLIGPLQSNKSRPVAEAFDWVHTVDRLQLAQRLAAQRPPHMPPLNLCIQVNTSGEASKSGAPLHEAAALAHAVAALGHQRVRLRGLMAIPEPAPTLALQRAQHRPLAELWQLLRAQGLALDTLSMGMSDDLEAAVAEGATVVRVGRAIFGTRHSPVL